MEEKRQREEPTGELPTIVKKDPDKERKAFKLLLKRTYGNYVRAWRQGLDRDGSGVLDESELKKACSDVGFAGSKKELWECLDQDGGGSVSLKEIDEHTFTMLKNIASLP